jgi:hypothetical protein
MQTLITETARRKNITTLKIEVRNNWVRCKPRLARCMNIIEDNDLFYMDDDIDETIDMKMAIILLQLFKDRYFDNDNPHLTLEDCVNPKLKNYAYYYYKQEKLKLKLDNRILEGEEEEYYLSSYSPPCRRRYLLQNISKNQEKSVDNSEK